MAKWKAVIPILLAVLIALLGSFLTYRWAKQQIQPGQSVHMDVETVAIAVASSDLGWGTQLTTDKVKLTPR